MTATLLASIPAMALVTFIVYVIATTTRLRAMNKAKIDPQGARHTDDLASLPDPARQHMDNYNHLLEQPTVFYALVLAVAAGGLADPAYAWMAWIYVVLRIAHSGVQMTVNIVMARFICHVLAWLVLVAIALRGLNALL